MSNKQHSYVNMAKNGLLFNNPIFVQLLGMCPTLATSTSASNAIGMGLSTTAVLVGSNFVISLLKNIIPSKIRIASYIVIIAGFVTLIEMLLNAYVPALAESLGLFIPLIVVNCIILARAESFASKNKFFPSAMDGIFMGLGFTGALTILGCIRELLGNGTIFGFALFGQIFTPILIFLLPPGAFITLGIVVGIINVLSSRKKEVA